MFDYIKGKIERLNPAAVTLETTGGVGYRLNISLATYSDIEGKNDARLFVHENIREDAWTLYGFSTERELQLFRALIGVSGVGAATAVIILSSMQGEELAAVITSGDVKRLKAIKGIGAKTAERIIVDLRDKLTVGDDAYLQLATVKHSDNFDEAMAALMMLGFERKASEKVLDRIFGEDSGIKLEAAIKRALSML